MSTVAEHIVAFLQDIGVQRIWGIAGDSANAFTDAVRRMPGVDWMHVRHEEAAAFAASGEAQVTGRLAVCAGSAGPGSLHLINGLYDAHASRAPVLAIATQIPADEIGTQFFQETHPERLFQECSHFCEVLSDPSQLPRMLELAVRAATLQQGVAVIVVPGDVSIKKAPEPRPYAAPFVGRRRPPEEAINALAAAIARSRKPTILAGIGCTGVEEDVIALAEKLKAPIVHAFRAKSLFETNNAFNVGLTGRVGIESAYEAVMGTDLLLMLGSDFPYLIYLPGPDTTVAQVDDRPAALGRRAHVTIPILADVGETARALLPQVGEDRPSDWLERSLELHRRNVETLNGQAQGRSGQRPVHPQFLAARLDEAATKDAIFTVDTGANSIWAARYINVHRTRTMIGSFRHGSMANALSQAMGAAAAYPGRQVIALAGDGGYAMLLSELLTLKQLSLPVKVVIFNNSLLGYVELEMKQSGYVEFGVDLQNPDFGALANAAGVRGVRIEDPGDLAAQLRAALEAPGPAIIDVVVEVGDLATDFLQPH